MKNMTQIYGKYYPRLFWIVILTSFIAWFIGLLINPAGHQLDLFFLRMDDFWADATNTTGYVSGLDPYNNNVNGLENHNYPPFPYILFYGLARVADVPQVFHTSSFTGYLTIFYQPMWTMLFVIVLIMILVLLSLICFHRLTLISEIDKYLIVISLVLSSPMLYTIERGNILIIAILALSIFVFYYDSDCRWKKEISLICLALSVGIKLSPVIFGFLLIQKKDWNSLFKTICYTIILLFVPFFFFKGNLQNIFQMIYNIKFWFFLNVEQNIINGTGLVSSYFHFAKFFWGDSYIINDKIYTVLMSLRIIISFILIMGAFFIKQRWKIILNLTIVLLIFPATSFTYNVLYMIPFTVLFLNSFLKEKITVDKIIVFICLVMLYFVYRCFITDFINYQFAIPILAIVASVNSIKAYFNKRKNFC